MPTLIPWTTVEIGDIDVFAPELPSLVVYTWYVNDEPESTITHIWYDDATGGIFHEVVLTAPVTFEAAVERAQEEAPKRSVERIHVKHARSKPKGKAKAKRAAKAGVTKSKRTTRGVPKRAAKAGRRK